MPFLTATKKGFFIMSNTAKQLVTTVETSNKSTTSLTPVAKTVNFDCATIDANKPPQAIYNFANGVDTYLVPNALLPFDKMLSVTPYEKGTAMGILAILMLTGVITLTQTNKTVNYVNAKGKTKVMPVFKVAINTGQIITYNTKAKSTTSVGALLSALMGQSYGKSGKSHNALVSALYTEQCHNGYNVMVKPFKVADIKPLVTLTKTKPTSGVKHNADIVASYEKTINALLKAYNFLIKA